MRLNTLGPIMIMQLFMLACLPCAQASDAGLNLLSARPTVGSIDCLRPTGIMSPACPHEIAAPGSLYNNPSDDVGAYRVLRIVASERFYERFSFLKPFDPHRVFSLPRGFSTNMVMGYPGANMYVDLEDLSVEWRLLGGTVRPFNNDDPYAVVRFSWRW